MFNATVLVCIMGVVLIALLLLRKMKPGIKEDKKTKTTNMKNQFFYYLEDQPKRVQRSSVTEEACPASVAIIYRSEMDYISRCINDYPNIETGGQLFGFVTEYGAPVVCYAIGPGPRANHQPAQFNQDTDYLQNTYNEINRKYGLRYIGEWHSHHQLGLAKPSGPDTQTVVRGIKRSNFRHFLLCIGNCDNRQHSTLNAFTYYIEDPYNYYHAPWDIIEMDSPYRAIIDREMRNSLYHPQTPRASHGSNYVISNMGAPSLVTPNYKDDYWMNNKRNNLILKKIMDFLTNQGKYAVKPMLDGQKNVHLIVAKGTLQEEIVLGEGFPYEAPVIKVAEGIHVNDEAKWEYEGDIFNSFVKYYGDYFKRDAVEEKADSFENESELPLDNIVPEKPVESAEPEEVAPQQEVVENNIEVQDESSSSQIIVEESHE